MRGQGYSLTTSASHLPLSDHILRLMMQNEQVEHEQPQRMIWRILRDTGKGKTKRGGERRERRRGKKEKREEERKSERERRESNKWQMPWMTRVTSS